MDNNVYAVSDSMFVWAPQALSNLCPSEWVMSLEDHIFLDNKNDEPMWIQFASPDSRIAVEMTITNDTLDVHINPEFTLTQSAEIFFQALSGLCPFSVARSVKTDSNFFDNQGQMYRR